MSNSVLTAKEWKAREVFLSRRDSFSLAKDGGVDMMDAAECVGLNDGAGGAVILPKIAALCLAGQPFGFTRKDVATLKIAQGATLCCGGVFADAEVLHIQDLLDRISALLPPEDV
jgi:hypothetical protein